MRRKVGIVSVYKKDANKNKWIKLRDTILWVSIINIDGSIFGKIYFDVDKDYIIDIFPLIKKLMIDNPSYLKMKYFKEFWGEYFQISYFNNIGYTDFESILSSFGTILVENEYKYCITINKKFKDVINDAILEGI